MPKHQSFQHLVYGTELHCIRKTVVMINILERIGIVRKEHNNGFKPVPVIITLLLVLFFVGTTFYVLINSLYY